MLGHKQGVACVLTLWRTWLSTALFGLWFATTFLARVLRLAVLIERGELVG